MDFLRLLEQIRVPGVTEFMQIITYLGDEIAFLAVALVIFWCVDKQKGYYVMTVGFIGTIANQFMKLWFRIPRPWVQDPSFTIVEQAREGAGGYSFPSGHTQSAVGTFGSIARVTGNKILRIVCIVLAVIVPFSRMYLGVHTPLDVSVAAIMGVVLIFLMKPLVLDHDGKYFPYVIGAMALISIGYLCFTQFYPFPADVDAENLASGAKNAYTLTGCVLGVFVVYPLDRKWIRFSVQAVWWAQILKVVIGLALVLAVKSVLTAPLAALFGELPGRMIRYFLVVVTAGGLWPLSFRFFRRIGVNNK